MVVKEQNTGTSPRRSPPTRQSEERALLEALVAQATRRGDTLTALAKNLGVSYERLAQWRRGEADIRQAKTAVHERAGQYLGVPTVLILALAGVISLEQFVWPAKDALSQRLAQELERLRLHPFLGPFVPAELSGAEPAVKLFVAFLFHEMTGGPESGGNNFRWVNALHQVTVDDAQVRGKKGVLRSKAPSESLLF